MGHDEILKTIMESELALGESIFNPKLLEALRSAMARDKPVTFLLKCLAVSYHRGRHDAFSETIQKSGWRREDAVALQELMLIGGEE